MEGKFILVTAVLIGALQLVNGEMTCQECRQLSKDAGDYYTRDQTIEEEIDIFLNKTCSDVMEEYENPQCHEELSKIWPTIAKALFNSKTGWYNHVEWCEDLDCNWDEVSEDTESRVDCESCVEAMQTSLYYFDDAIILSDIIYGFQYLGFCDAVDDPEVCRKRFLFTFPRVMRQLKEDEMSEKRHSTFCQTVAKCSSA